MSRREVNDARRCRSFELFHRNYAAQLDRFNLTARRSDRRSTSFA